ncbi:hypothetical protein BFJ72_g1902 [Fusarium proliferatum]|uniref:Uncharacterized protein n=1 Tax=Gibberella intermedia TaxID=948311 RepID=A0A420U1J2_GIBIN|nr:hypothetical protein BFJ72_g1902 [Fusarium proliferatum]
MDLHHSPPRKRSKSFHTTCQDTAQFAHPVHAESDPMDIDRPGHATQDSTTILASTGATAANSGILHHEENDLSPEERRVEVYTRSIMPAPNTKDAATNDLFPYRMSFFTMSISIAMSWDRRRAQINLPLLKLPRKRCLCSIVKDLVALTDKMKLEIHMNLPWRDFVSLAKATAPLRDAGFQLSVTFNEEEWSDIPSQYRDFHKALAVKAITGAELDAANLRFQQDMPEFIADQLTARGTHGYRPNKRR